VWSRFVLLAFGWGFVGVMVTLGISLLACSVAVILKIRSMNTCPLSVGQNVGLPLGNVPVQGDPGVPDVNQLEDELVRKIFLTLFFVELRMISYNCFINY
jgi:hypothetical protein